MLRYFFCKVICICQNGSVAGRQPPGEDVGEGCSVPAAHQNGRSSISNILGNSWGLPVHVLRVICIFSSLWCRRLAPPSWLRLDCRHCTISNTATTAIRPSIGRTIRFWRWRVIEGLMCARCLILILYVVSLLLLQTCHPKLY